MKKPYRFYNFGVDGAELIIGIEPGTTMIISLGRGIEYRASIERIHKAMAAWHAKEHPATGKRKCRRFSHA